MMGDVFASLYAAEWRNNEDIHVNIHGSNYIPNNGM